MVDNSQSKSHTDKYIFNKIRTLSSSVKYYSKRSKDDVHSNWYYCTDPITEVRKRKRSYTLILDLKVNKLIKFLVMAFHLDMNKRTLRYMVWKIFLPLLLKKDPRIHKPHLIRIYEAYRHRFIQDLLIREKLSLTYRTVKYRSESYRIPSVLPGYITSSHLLRSIERKYMTVQTPL